MNSNVQFYDKYHVTNLKSNKFALINTQYKNVCIHNTHIFGIMTATTTKSGCTGSEANAKIAYKRIEIKERERERE